MKPMSQLIRRMRDAATPAERPLVVFVFAEPARPPEAEAAPGKTLPHLDIELAISVFERADMPEETRKSYTGELRRQAEWLDGRPPTDRLLEEYLDMLYDKGRAPPSAVTAVAAVERAVRELALDGYEIAEPPAGPLAARRLKRFRREGAERGPGQVRGLTWDEVKLMCKTAKGDGPRGKRDAAIIGVATDGLMRVFRGIGAERRGRVVPAERHGGGPGPAQQDGPVRPRRRRAPRRGCHEVPAILDQGRRDQARSPVPAGGSLGKRLGQASRAGLCARRDQAAGARGGDPGPGVRPLAAHRHGAEAGRRGHVAGRDPEGGPLEVARHACLLRARAGGVPWRGGSAARRRGKVKNAAEEAAKKGVAPPETAVLEFG